MSQSGFPESFEAGFAAIKTDDIATLTRTTQRRRIVMMFPLKLKVPTLRPRGG